MFMCTGKEGNFQIHFIYDYGPKKSKQCRFSQSDVFHCSIYLVRIPFSKCKTFIGHSGLVNSALKKHFFKKLLKAASSEDRPQHFIFKLLS